MGRPIDRSPNITRRSHSTSDLGGVKFRHAQTDGAGYCSLLRPSAEDHLPKEREVYYDYLGSSAPPAGGGSRKEGQVMGCHAASGR